MSAYVLVKAGVFVWTFVALGLLGFLLEALRRELCWWRANRGLRAELARAVGEEARRG